MKLFNIFAFVLLLLPSYWATGQGIGDNLYDNSYVHNIEITFSEPNFWDTLTAYYDLIYPIGGGPVGPKKYLPAQIKIDGVTIDTVGVRQKGFFSNWGAFNSNKKPLKVDINEFVSGQKYDGLKKFNLNNGFEDPSMMRELVALDMMRKAGLKVPRVAYANVYLNGTHWGLYILMEQVDKTFLNENFSNGNGNLYKCMENTNLEWKGSMDTSYQREFELKTNEDIADWSDFIRFVKIINKHTIADSVYLDSLHSIFNVQDYFKALAIDMTINNWDAYHDHGRNFYVYQNPDDGKFHWIPWDYNLSFASYGSDILLQNGFEPKPLIDNMLADTSLRKQYLDTYCDILTNNITLSRLSPIIDSTHNMLLPHHTASTNEFFTTAEFSQNATAAILTPWGDSIPGLKNMITGRTADINAELAQLNHTCNAAAYINAGDVVINEFMAENDSTTSFADQDGEYDDWIELYNNTSTPINLNGYFLSDDFDNAAQWSFPDTTIAANGYLIVWADKDGNQMGLHADFKLSKSGEEIILSAPNNAVIDSVTYGSQQLPNSYARQPNGTGAFAVSAPTFGTLNVLVSTRSVEQMEVKVFPNPVNNQLNIRLEEQGKIKAVRLVNLFGQTVIEQPINAMDTDLTLEVSRYPSGMYVLVFQTVDNEVFNSKIMIAH